MARLSINEMTTYRWSFEDDVRNYAAAGIKALAVWRPKLSDFGDQKGIELLNEYSMKVSSLLWSGGFTGSEGSSFKEGIQDAVEAIQLASEMKAESLVVYSGARHGHTHNHARRLMRSALKELAPIAAEKDVTLSIEPMHPGCATEWTFLTDLDDALALLDEVGSLWVKLAFDTYHLGHDENIVARLPEIISKIAVVHLADARQEPNGEQNRCILGEGQLPLHQLVGGLIEAGYEGFFELELMGEDVEHWNYYDIIDQSQEAFADLSCLLEGQV